MVVCPVFVKDLARAIVSAGKFLQLVNMFKMSMLPHWKGLMTACLMKEIAHIHETVCQLSKNLNQKMEMKDLQDLKMDIPCVGTLSWIYQSHLHNGSADFAEVFLVSLAGLVGDRRHLCEYFKMSSPEIPQILTTSIDNHIVAKGANENLMIPESCENIWFKFLDDTISERKRREITGKGCPECIFTESDVGMEETGAVLESQSLKSQHCNNVNDLGFTLSSQIFTVNPVVIVCREFLSKNMATCNELNISRNLHLPSLNDECLRETIFGDLLQQFLLVIYDKLDKGESWDDDFELNTILQESIRNSADGSLLSSPDSLVVSITKQSPDDEANTTSNVATPRKGRSQFLGIDPLDLLKFSYKVSWPLDLIANTQELTKYNQVMGFLLKAKWAKFVLDKARKWMWKSKRSTAQHYKHHLLLEQKLLHFVDAFHQCVMDRVFHSAWIELCSGMASAASLDEVIEVNEAYLLSIQRQCFVAPDKLWALIASRIKSILGLAHDFYWIQQTLSSGGVAPAIKAKCEMEVDLIEKQFDDCIAFF